MLTQMSMPTENADLLDDSVFQSTFFEVTQFLKIKLFWVYLRLVVCVLTKVDLISIILLTHIKHC